MPFAYGLNGGVDGVALIVARFLATAVVVIGLQDDLFLLGEPVPSTRGILPKGRRGRECIKLKGGFALGACAGTVVEGEGVAIARKNKGDV